MSGSATLLVPSQSRTLEFDARPGTGAPAWPNKNAEDALDYWLDCNGLIADIGGGATVQIAQVSLQIVTGDGQLQILQFQTPGAAPSAPSVSVYVQDGVILWMLGGGTPSGAYTLLVSVTFTGTPSRLYTKTIGLTLSATPVYGTMLMGGQTSYGLTQAGVLALLAGADLSAATATPAGGAPIGLATLAALGTAAGFNAQLGVGFAALPTDPTPIASGEPYRAQDSIAFAE